jgi:acyl-CoA synthetase (NDP forming)
LAETFSAFLADDFDLSLCLLDYPRADKCDPSSWEGAEKGFIRAAKQTGARTGVLSTFSDTMPEPLAEQLVEEGIVPLAGIDSGLAGIQAAVDIGAAWERPTSAPLMANQSRDEMVESRVLDEAESKSMLAKYGVPVPDFRVVADAREAASAATELGFPVVVKALGVAHKTETGGVALNLKSEGAVAEAVKKMSRLTERFLVERMVEGVVAELIVGVARDEQFGPHMVVGGGGILVELMKDSRSLLLPFTKDEVMRSLDGLQCAPLFSGFRGRPRADLHAVSEAILAIANLVEDNAAAIEELDVNPLLLLAEGHGVMAADVLLSMKVESCD